ATLHEGRVTQVGDTAAVYRTPTDIATAQVFSDPPMNTAAVAKRDGEIRLGDAARWPAAGPIADAPDGDYQVGLRPHFVAPNRQRDDMIALPGEVRITELSGSESVAHFDCAGGSWVSLSHGTHAYSVGEPHQFFIDTRGCLYFGADGARIGSA
ncbi:MAG: ABC transporter ATP-binding protein, partial [Pseudomonadota bacterium]